MQNNQAQRQVGLNQNKPSPTAIIGTKSTADIPTGGLLKYNTYKSFKIGLPEHKVKDALNPEHWPEGALVRMFRPLVTLKANRKL
ncbi:hypothetical protein J6590_086081 [Homalodisca vitripennis]|nr:hypothetical protein J6590_086081 [Homalodisca vitripennis]